MSQKNNSSRRRGNGEGTIYKRGVKWCAQIHFGKKRKSATFKTHREAQKWIHEIKTKMLQDTERRDDISFGEFSRDWLLSKKLSVSAKTNLQYEGTLRVHLIPVLGNTPIKDITSADINDALTAINNSVLLKRKSKNPIVTRTAFSAYQILKMIFGYALERRLLSENPMLFVERPRYKSDLSMHILSQEQVVRLTNAGEKFNFDAVCALTVTTGLREGEVLGLKWQDIDVKGQFIRVHQQVQYLPGQGIRVTELKTISSRRRIPIGKNVLKKLLRHKRHVEKMKAFAGERWQENDLVFPSSVGTPISVQNFLRKYKKILKSAGLPNIRFHDLRHTAASLMLQNGIHIKVVSERLGHSDIRITLQLYSHLMPTIHRNAADTMDHIYD